MSSETGQIYIFDVESGNLSATYTSHAMAVRTLSWSPDSNVRASFTYTRISLTTKQLLLSGSEDKRLILHDVRVSASGKPGSGAVASLSGHSSWVLSTDISPDGRLALSGCDDHIMNLTFVLTGMIYSSADRTIKVWDLTARAAVSTIQDTGEVWSVSWRPKPSGNNSAGAFISGGEDGHVRWWRAAGTA